MSSDTAREKPLPGPVSSGARILARSFYRELRSNGYTPAELVAVSTEIIELVTLELRNGGAGFDGAARRPQAAASNVRATVKSAA